MNAKTILVPVDGASNIKLETLDFETLATVHSASTDSSGHGITAGLKYNATGKEFDWFDSALSSRCRKSTGRRRWSRRSRAALRAAWSAPTTR